jgi:hypothetical protein
MAYTFVGTASSLDSDASQALALADATAKATSELGKFINIGFTQYYTKLEGETKPYTYNTKCTISVTKYDEVSSEDPAAATNTTTENTTGNSNTTVGNEDPAVATNTTTENTTGNSNTTVGNEDPAAAATEANQTTNEETTGPTEADVQAYISSTKLKDSVAQYDTPSDWRVRISLAPKADYLYMAAEPGILAPLKETKGVIFPYTPTISVTYNAQYDTQDVTHSNYKMHNYRGSSVENITVTGDFTAQDITEANYMLAVIHFFRSSSKMFYGKDANRGTPPPLLYLTGHGQYQFDNHPMVLTGFTYTLPTDVDYINAYPGGVQVGINGAQLTPYQPGGSSTTGGPVRSFLNSAMRLDFSGLMKGATSKSPVFAKPPVASNSVTRVPTKINISLTFMPIITRNAISNEFSLKDYASGKLLRGSQNPKAGGGIW